MCRSQGRGLIGAAGLSVLLPLLPGCQLCGPPLCDAFQDHTGMILQFGNGSAEVQCVLSSAKVPDE
jgi:hypothetical protein